MDLFLDFVSLQGNGTKTSVRFEYSHLHLQPFLTIVAWTSAPIWACQSFLGLNLCLREHDNFEDMYSKKLIITIGNFLLMRWRCEEVRCIEEIKMREKYWDRCANDNVYSFMESWPCTWSSHGPNLKKSRFPKWYGWNLFNCCMQKRFS